MGRGDDIVKNLNLKKYWKEEKTKTKTKINKKGLIT